jgi:hypothetical protein
MRQRLKNFKPDEPTHIGGGIASPIQASTAPKRAQSLRRFFSDRQFFPRTRFERREAVRRKLLLERFDGLRSKGLSGVAAARELRVAYTSLWRYRKRLLPQTHLSGRKPMAPGLQIPGWALAQVQRLQLSGKGNAAAWRALPANPRCPPHLAKFLRTAKSLPPSLLKLTRLQRQRITALTGPNFFAVINSRNS